MKFYTLKEIPIARDDVVFKASPLSSFLAMLVFLGISIALLVLGKHGGYFKHGWNVPSPIAYVISGVCGLGALALFGAFRARLKPTNWLLRCNATGVIIKYRAYQNWRMPADDVQAVGLDYSEIAWARKASERRVSERGNEKQVQCLTFLDFGLVRPDTSDLQKRLDDERQRPWSFRSLTYPVEVLPGGIVRLQWSAGGGKSNLNKALQWLARFVTIADKVSGKVDLTRQIDGAPREEDGKILQLVRSGDKIGAIELTRQTYGCSLNEAVKFVEKL